MTVLQILVILCLALAVTCAFIAFVGLLRVDRARRGPVRRTSGGAL